jgi:DNA-directed RNA polymerase specialized sigma subunit
MNAKQWLSRARFIDREIALLQKTKEETRDNLTKITQSYESDGAQTTKDPHKYDRLVELENEIDQKVDELIDTKREILNVIFKVEDRNQRQVLISYYIRMKTLEKIAVEMNYSFRQIVNIRRHGIMEVQKLINCNNL